MNDRPTVSDAPERSLDPEDWDAFRELAHRMLDSALDHVEGAREGPVWTPMPDHAKLALTEPLPMEPQGTEKVCQDVVGSRVGAVAH